MTAFAGEVHPLADVFPMLDGDSLQALADDIAVNGLRDRIVIDKQGRLVDGRNRLAACRLAGVTPAYVSWPVLGTEEGVAAWIASANLQRRDLTQGQKAHLAVRLCSKLEQTARDVSRIAGVPLARIGEAQTIAQFCPDLPAQVIAGTLPHVEAYRRALAAKAAHTSPAGGGEHLDHEDPGPRGQQQTPAKRRKPLTDQARTTFIWITRRIDADASERFMHQLTAKTDLASGSPILALDTRFREMARTRTAISGPAALSAFIRAWNAWRQGKPMVRIHTHRDGFVTQFKEVL